MEYYDFAMDDEFARRDGFKDHFELQKWFGGSPYHSLYRSVDEYDVISWDPFSLVYTTTIWVPVEGSPKIIVADADYGSKTH